MPPIPGLAELGGTLGQALKVTPINNLTQGFNFVVMLNEFTYGFQEISGIEIARPFEQIEEGGVNDHKILVGESLSSNTNVELTFKRGMMVRSTAIVSNAAKAAAARITNNLARKAALIAVNATDPQESLESGPSLGMIYVYSRTKKLKAIFSFLSFGMTKWSLDNLNASSGEVLIEDFTVMTTGITRHPVSWVPSLGNVFSGGKDDSDVAKDAEYAVADRTTSEERKKAAGDAAKAWQEEFKLYLEELAKKRELWEAEKEKRALEEELAKEEAEAVLEELKEAMEEADKAREEAEKRRAEAAIEVEEKQKEMEEEFAKQLQETQDIIDKHLEQVKKSREESAERAEASDKANEEARAAIEEWQKEIEKAREESAARRVAADEANKEAQKAIEEWQKEIENSREESAARREAADKANEEARKAVEEWQKQRGEKTE